CCHRSLVPRNGAREGHLFVLLAVRPARSTRLTIEVKPVLSAVVVYIRGRGKCRVATQVTIRLGDMPVARATLGGPATQADALGDFRRGPQRFQRLEGWEMARAFRLVG